MASVSARIGIGRRVVALAAAAVAISGAGVTYLVMHAANEGGVASDGKGRPSITGFGSVAGDRDLMAIFDPNEPLLPGGSEVTLEYAASLVPYPIFRPEGSDGGQPEVWLSSSGNDSGITHEAALRYDSNLVLTYGRWPEGTEPGEAYERLVAQWKAGYTTIIAGHPAWVVPPDAQAPGSPPVSVVHVTLDEVEVTLFGKMPIEQVMSLAEGLTS